MNRREVLKLAGAAACAAVPAGGRTAVAATTKKAATDIHVSHEWGELKECMVGIGTNIINPSWSEEFIFLPEKDQKAIRRDAGKPLVECTPDLAEALNEQVENFAAALKKLGVKVHRNQPLEGPEADYLWNIQKGRIYIYTRDPMLTIGSNVMEMSLRTPMRRKERWALRPALDEALEGRNVEIVSMPPAAPSDAALKPGNPKDPGPYLEGGDVLLNGREIYVGISGKASDIHGANWLQAYLGPEYTVFPVRLKPEFLHLDCVLSLLRPGLMVICPEAFLDPLPGELAEWQQVKITPEESTALGANGLILNDKTAIWGAEHTRIIAEIKKAGQEVIPLPYDAVSRMGGAFRCSHHPLRRG